MSDEPDIVKELKEAEKLEMLHSKVQSEYKELERIEELPEDVPKETTRFVEDDGVEKRETVCDATGYEKVEEKLRLFLHSTESSTDGIAMGNLEGKITYVNEAFVRMFGYSRKELIGKEIPSIYSGDQIPKLEEVLKATMEGGWIRELVGKRKNGELFLVEISSSRVVDDKGKVIAQVAGHRGVTGRKKAKEALKESEEKFRTFVDTASDLMIIADKDGTFTDVNEAMAKTLGYSKEELIGMRIPQILTNESLENEFKPNWKKFVTNGEITIEAAFVTKNGKEIYGDLKAVAIYDSDGKFAGSRAVFHDLTERKQAEEKLKENEEKLRSLVETTSDWIWEVDKNGIYTYASPKVKDLLGYSPEEVIGKTPFDLMPKDEVERVSSIFLDCTKSNKPIIGLENTNLHKDGRCVILETSGVPILDANGNLLGYRGIDRDITERKKVDEVLQDAKEKLERKVNELERYKKLTVGRELKMRELKKKIKELEGGVRNEGRR